VILSKTSFKTCLRNSSSFRISLNLSNCFNQCYLLTQIYHIFHLTLFHNLIHTFLNKSFSLLELLLWLKFLFRLFKLSKYRKYCWFIFNDLIHFWLSKERLILFIVSISSKSNNINKDILFKLESILNSNFECSVKYGRLLSINMENRSSDNLSNFSTIIA
jgi:hypothetical protein